ncbi:hypothetical protein PHYPSEUDO_005698 [Phytophthora pseudosyringae]|uniref:Uncharacterized protein n=1 Tax=Phytophthora pseudosyringae TaxID=221518 RepID=A0A8T1VLF5_9STRA|nr:hypothetical protein PHYPSEUDO_005698 [Phytophthora pseudosyringae]
MCGASDAVCLHGDCVVEAAEGAAYEHCRCYAMYSGAQCSFRGEMLVWELPVACALMLILLGIGVLVSGKALVWLRFSQAKQDAFAFPRKWEALPGLSLGARLLRGKWTGPTRKGLPTKPTRDHIVENALVFFVAIMELLPWVQMAALGFLPVVPWPKASRGVAEILRLSLLYPMWSHFEPTRFPRLMLYLSLGIVPGILLIASVIGAKRFPLFKPQPKKSPAEDLCTIVLRLYSEWLALPTMIGLLLPLECGVIGYSKTEGSGTTLPTLSGSCFTLLQGGMVAAGTFMLILFCTASSVIVIQLNCESSRPEPTLWTHVAYTRVAHVLKAPLAMSVVGSANANALLLCASCMLISLILGIMNANLKPCVFSLVNGLRLAGAVMGFWTSLLALVTSLMDDPGVTIVYEAWSLGAIALSAASLPGLFLYHTEDFWRQRGSSAKAAGSSSLAAVTKDGKGASVVAAPAKAQSGKVAAVGFRAGLPKVKPGRRSSAAEKLRSRSKRGTLTAAAETS